MKKPWFISIRSKILFVLSAVLVAAVGLYLFLASKLFFEDKKLLVYELNQTSVRSLGQEVETHFKRILDKLQILATLMDRDPKTTEALLPQLVGNDEGFLRIAVMNATGETKVVGTWAKELELDGKDATHLDRIRAEHPMPFSRIMEKGVWIRNTTTEIPTVTVAVKISDTQIMYADLKLDRVLESFTASGLAHTYLMDSDGFALADSDHLKVASHQDLKSDPLMSSAIASKLRSELKSYNENGVAYLGSFFRLGLGDLVVGSKTQTGEAFAAAQVLIRKSILYALLVVTVAFLISLFLSHSITEPIRNLVDATHKIAQGEFNIALKPRTRDELALLSNSFNSMTDDLRSSREQLKVAHEQLVHSERLGAIGQVARSIGHEFGNILFVITGNADFALQSKTLEKAQERVKQISAATERASLIVRNLNSFAKHTSTKTAVDPAKLITDTLSLVDHELMKSNVKVERVLQPTRTIVACASEIEQVLLNLLINASHAMPKGGSIEIGCKDESGQVVMWVKDNGTGIPPDVLPKIFDFAFTTKGDKGSGLGLAISKQIIENHQGTLAVSSTVGVGTQFTLTLPEEAKTA